MLRNTASRVQPEATSNRRTVGPQVLRASLPTIHHISRSLYFGIIACLFPSHPHLFPWNAALSFTLLVKFEPCILRDSGGAICDSAKPRDHHLSAFSRARLSAVRLLIASQFCKRACAQRVRWHRERWRVGASRPRPPTLVRRRRRLGTKRKLREHPFSERWRGLRSPSSLLCS